MDTARAQIAFDLAGVSILKAGTAAAVCGIVFLLLGWRIDINLFSLRNFYRNRLPRRYLGASRACGPENHDQDCRKPNPFTGFDPSDDMALTALPLRPYALFNTALNLVGGHELAWKQRKAASFTFSPMFCGYELPIGMGRGRGTYRATDCFLAGELKGEYRDEPSDQRGVRLGTAIAISGAAVCPNMGFLSSPAVSFLLTVFNLRLGRWVGNPDMSEKIWRKTSPLLCRTRPDSAWISGKIGDGTHRDKTDPLRAGDPIPRRKRVTHRIVALPLRLRAAGRQPADRLAHQDHLRRMGLARKAMMRLLAENPGLELDFDSFQPTRKTDAANVIHQAVLRHLFESVQAILAAGGKSPTAQERRMG